MIQLIARNMRPLSLVILFSIIGYFAGSALSGFLVAVAIICLAHLFF
jgi:tetrahydromethanopterin S-methyltransferase subunit F